MWFLVVEVILRRMAMDNDESLPDHLRCTRTDGRHWRCSRRVMESKKLCQIHHIQGLLRQYKRKVPESLKIQRGLKRGRSLETDSELHNVEIRAEKDMQMEVLESLKIQRGLQGQRSLENDSEVSNVKIRAKKETNIENPESLKIQRGLKHERSLKNDSKVYNVEARAKKKMKFFKRKTSIEEKECLPDHLRCSRTDGRQWRCNRLVMENKRLCQIHHIQGRHRQKKQKVPESLKLQRRAKGRKSLNKELEFLNVEIRAKKKTKIFKLKSAVRVSEALDEALKKMKLKKGDLQLELIRMFLKRQVERTKKRDLEKTKNSESELMRELPNGLMAISPAPPMLYFGNVGVSCDIKLGLDSGSFMRRFFRSKNIEPLPISSLKVVPYGGSKVKVQKNRLKNFQCCLKNNFRSSLECLSC